jgi:hypothetical protein
MRRSGAHQQGVAVRRRLRSNLRTDVAVGARAIVDEHRLRPGLGELLSHGPCKDVRRAGRRIRHDDAHGLGRIRRLREHGSRANGQDGAHHRGHSWARSTHDRCSG